MYMIEKINDTFCSLTMYVEESIVFGSDFRDLDFGEFVDVEFS